MALTIAKTDQLSRIAQWHSAWVLMHPEQRAAIRAFCVAADPDVSEAISPCWWV
jgi:hypothetical protein